MLDSRALVLRWPGDSWVGRVYARIAVLRWTNLAQDSKKEAAYRPGNIGGIWSAVHKVSTRMHAWNGCTYACTQRQLVLKVRSTGLVVRNNTDSQADDLRVPGRL